MNGSRGGLYPPPGVEIKVNAGGGDDGTPPGVEIEGNEGGGGPSLPGVLLASKSKGTSPGIERNPNGRGGPNPSPCCRDKFAQARRFSSQQFCKGVC